MSKGSKRRPQQVSHEELERRWRAAFSKPVRQVVQNGKVEEVKTKAVK